MSKPVTSGESATSPGGGEPRKPHAVSQLHGLRSANGQRGPGPQQVPELVISWRGFRRRGDREQVTYLVNDEPVGKGKDGFRQVVERASQAEPNTRILLPKGYFVTGIGPERPEPCPSGYWPPYCDYDDLLEELSAVAKARGLEIWDVGGWDEETGEGELLPGARHVGPPDDSEAHDKPGTQHYLHFLRKRPGGTDEME